MEQHFEKQLEDAEPLTEEILEAIQGKKDYFGTVLEAGHTVLYCIVQSDVSAEDKAEYGANLNMQIVKVAVESFKVLEEDFEYLRHSGENKFLPVFVAKEEA